MNSFKTLLASAFIALPVALTAIPIAAAGEIYTYTGKDFTNADGHVFTTSDFVTATLVYAYPLSTSTTSTAVPMAWTISAGPLTLTSATGNYLTAGTLTISITTDATGAIEEWSLTAIGPFVSVAPPTNATLDTLGSRGGGAFDWADDPLEGGDGGGPQLAGTWTAVPEPSSPALLGSGLAIVLVSLTWNRRRRCEEAIRS